jgi:hypothetical protein
MGQGKGNLGGKFSPWGHRLDLEAKAARLADPLTYLNGRGGLGHAPLQTLATGPTTVLHISLSRLHVGEALLQKFSTISTTSSCCGSNLSLHHTCWTKEGGDIVAPYMCISRRRRHLRRWIGSDREETASTTTSSTFHWTFPMCDFFKCMKISSISLVDYIS